MPNVKFTTWVIDTLATRYGWTSKHIWEDLYWEDVWDYVQVAANYSAFEANQARYFQFMLHAGSKKAVKNWKDSPLPFPSKKYKQKKPHYGGLSDLPNHIPVKINKKINGK